ncbi:MAG: outer membrane protein [Gammaproteobacteria bacterium]
MFKNIARNLALLSVVMMPPSAFAHFVAGVQMSGNWLQDMENRTVDIAQDGVIDEFIPDNDTNQLGWGLFLGYEWHNIVKAWDLQLGLGYDAVDLHDIQGEIFGNADPTFHALDYQYDMLHQRLNAEFKLLREFDVWYPYITANMGVAWNKTEDYTEESVIPGELPRTDLFSGTTQANFTYGVGFGIERALGKQWRVGLGYLYTHAGNAILENNNTGDHLEQQVQFQELLLQISFNI